MGHAGKSKRKLPKAKVKSETIASTGGGAVSELLASETRAVKPLDKNKTSPDSRGANKSTSGSKNHKKH